MNVFRPTETGAPPPAYERIEAPAFGSTSEAIDSIADAIDDYRVASGAGCYHAFPECSPCADARNSLIAAAEAYLDAPAAPAAARLSQPRWMTWTKANSNVKVTQ